MAITRLPTQLTGRDRRDTVSCEAIQHPRILYTTPRESGTVLRLSHTEVH